MKRTLCNLAVAIVAVAWTFASCSTLMDVDRQTVETRQAIDLLEEGKRLQKAGDYPLALDRFNKAVTLSPSPALFYHIGACYYAQAQYPQARESLQKALALAPDYPEALFLMSKVRTQLALAQRRGETPSPATPPAATRTPTPTPRVVAQAPTPTPIRPIPAPRPTPTPTPRPIQPTPTPRGPIGPVPTPPPSVEEVQTPSTRIPGNLRATPKPTPGPLPAVLPREMIFPGITGAETVDLTGQGVSTGTTVHLQLGNWRFHWDKAQSFLERNPPLLEEAVEELHNVLGARPRHTEARLALADAYDKLGRGEKALRELDNARLYDPQNPKTWFRTGNYYLGHAEDDPEHLDRAIRYYYAALNLDPNYYFAYHNIGVAYLKLNDLERARRNFEAALNVKPDYASAHYNLGILYEQHLNRPQDALRHYQRYLELGGEDQSVRESIAAIRESLP